LASKIFVVVESSDGQDLQKYCAKLADAFLNNEKIKFTAPRIDADFLLSYYYAVPTLWNKDFEDKTLPLISKEAAAAKMEENAKSLYSLEGSFTQEFIAADPLGLLPIFAEELKKLNFTDALEINNGVITSKDGKRALLIFDYGKNFLDAGAAREINAFFQKLKKELPGNITAFYMGAPRYTFENSSIINEDIKKIFTIAGVLMFILFLVFFRDKKSLFIYVLPSAIVVFAGVITSLAFNGVSGITIGFGAVLTGLCIDYSVYIYFALKATKEEDSFKTISLMFKPIAVSAGTSIAGFLLLLLSDTLLFKQISVFCAVGLAAAFFIALFVMPFIFDCKAQSSIQNAKAAKKTRYCAKNIRLRPPFAAFILTALFICSFIGFKHVKFNASFEVLNTVSKNFEADKKIFEAFTGNAYNDNEFLFVFGDTKEQALENNARLAALNKGDLPLAKLFPSKKQKEINVENWKKFWTPERIKNIKNEIEKAAKKYNINPKIFDGFYSFLKNAKAADGRSSSLFALEQVYNPIVEYDGKYAFVNIVKSFRRAEPKAMPLEKSLALASEDGGKTPIQSVFPKIQNDNISNIGTLLISNEILSDKIKTELFGNFYKIISLVILCSFALMALLLKNVKSAVLAMLPSICGLGAFFAAAALFKVEINIFGIFAMPLLIALGIDYGIFMIFKKTKSHNLLHPSKAVIAAALSTLIGFGSLMAAQHKVLFIIGFMVFIGILTSILITLFIVPSFLKEDNENDDLRRTI
jgi:predicted exporter